MGGVRTLLERFASEPVSSSSSVDLLQSRLTARCSSRFGRASAPMIPHRALTMRGPNVGTGTSSGRGSAIGTVVLGKNSQVCRLLSRVLSRAILPKFRIGSR
jgi:hypothetical protein